jgi:hypothetical protein
MTLMIDVTHYYKISVRKLEGKYHLRNSTQINLGYGDMYSIHLSQVIIQCRYLVNTVMNL